MLRTLLILLRSFIFPVYVLLFLSPLSAYAQSLSDLAFVSTGGFSIGAVTTSDSVKLPLSSARPLFSFHLNNRKLNSGEAELLKKGRVYTQVFDKSVSVTFSRQDSTGPGFNGEIVFHNTGLDTLVLSNVLPFGESDSSVYITASGPAGLTRAFLHLPGSGPVSIILPDNAWDLGYASISLAEDLSVCALARREKSEGGVLKRYETVLPPQAKVRYAFHADFFRGAWQNGLRLMFRDRFLYETPHFDNSLYERRDLSWIRDSWVIVLRMAWDREFYDRFSGKYGIPETISNGSEIQGKIDVLGLWPSWPRLGLDQRSQWDLYRDLPGGTALLRKNIRTLQQEGTHVFLSYNPWDRGSEDEHLAEISRIISETGSDGLILDTKANSSLLLQNTADSVRNGVLMYSEGMAVPADMQYIIAGRVHNAIYLSPELNLNRLIKPDFAIFRVCDPGEAPIHRELAVSFFNGYGTELNMFRPGGKDDQYREDLDFLARTTFLLRQNSDAFHDRDWIPLAQTMPDRVYLNEWKSEGKTVYTILNMRPEGVSANLIRVEDTSGKHYVSLWGHEELKPAVSEGKLYVRINADPWKKEYSGTRMEGSVDCVAGFPLLLKTGFKGDTLRLGQASEGSIIVWKGNPSYKTIFREYNLPGDTSICIRDIFGFYEGKIVVQLVQGGKLKDENVLYLKCGKPWLVSKMIRTRPATEIPEGMVLVPGTRFSFNVNPNDEFIPYPDVSGTEYEVDSFLIDIYPVTNAQYYDFMLSTGYRPADTARFLRNWQSGTFRQGQDKYPVVYLSYEDMAAYARWAGKRLPTQAEWQLCAQGSDKRMWPWGNEFHGTYCNNSFNRPTPVDAFPRSASPYGAIDMVGNVWQMTNDIYFNGSYYFGVIRGGSHLRNESSRWFLQNGPQPLDKTQMLLMVSPGFDRSSTVGFRCVKDIDSSELK